MRSVTQFNLFIDEIFALPLDKYAYCKNPEVAHISHHQLRSSFTTLITSRFTLLIALLAPQFTSPSRRLFMNISI